MQVLLYKAMNGIFFWTLKHPPHPYHLSPIQTPPPPWTQHAPRTLPRLRTVLDQVYSRIGSFSVNLLIILCTQRKSDIPVPFAVLCNIRFSLELYRYVLCFSRTCFANELALRNLASHSSIPQYAKNCSSSLWLVLMWVNKRWRKTEEKAQNAQR